MPLLNFFQLQNLLFAFMMFAAGAALDLGGGGGGGTDGGTDGQGTGGDGAGSGDGTGGEAGDDGQGSADGGERDGGGGGGETGTANQADPNALVDLGDGRTVPGKWKNLFDQAQKAGLGKEVKQLYFAQQRIAKAFPNGGVNGAIELAEQVEQFGGIEGIEQLQSDIETYHEDAELFERGDPRWIETSFQENPEASLKAFNHALGYVADHNPEHYDHVMAKVVLDTLDNGSPVAHIYNLLAGLKDNPQAKAAAEALAKWYNAVKDTASKIPEKKIDAQAKAVTDRETKVEQREMQVRYTQVNTECHPVLVGQVVKTLQAEAKLKNLDLKKLADDYPGEFRSMKNEIQREVMQAAIKDQRFVDKYYALVKKGDLKRAAAAVNAKHEKIVPGIVLQVAARYGFMRGKKAGNANAGGGKANAGGGNAGDTTGWTRVDQKPANHLIDYGKTSQAMQLDGKYILKDGKKVIVHY
jgi:hypothetical protein